MAGHKNVTRLFLVSVIIVLFFSCTTYNHRNPYPNMEILPYTNSQAYLFTSTGTEKLIIIIEGSGWESVLGTKGKNRWTEIYYGGVLLKELNTSHTVLIPEKLKRQPGMVYIEDMDDREHYTAENLIACYSESINSYLINHEFSSIVLIGISEGAALLPLVYEKMNDKDKIVAMVSISFGGLSFYESYKILSNRLNVHPGWLEFYFSALYIFDPDNKPEDNKCMNSFEEGYYGYTIRWYSSLIHIRPFDYYRNITIPILFVHGLADYNVAVESTKYIQENLPEKPFEFLYYKWGHGPGKYRDIIQLRKDIAKWVMEID